MKNAILASLFVLLLFGSASAAIAQNEQPPGSPDFQQPCSEVANETPRPLRLNSPSNANCICRFPQDCAISPCDQYPTARRFCRVSPAR